MARTPVAYPIFTFRWLAVHALVVRVPGAAESSGRLWAPRGSKRLQEAPRGSKKVSKYSIYHFFHLFQKDSK